MAESTTAEDPLHKPPFVPIDGLGNFRDIGGWAIADTSTEPQAPARVRKGILYRGPDLGPITTAGVQQLKDLGVGIIFDIRSVPQIVRAGGVKELEGIKRVWVPVFEEKEYTPEKAGLRYVQYSGDGTEGIVQAFEEILTRGAHTFRTILLYLSSSPTPCMMHCTTGNNRSGAFIGILLSLLGVSPEDVATEYALSEIGLARGRDKVVARLLKNEKFKEACGSGEEGKRRAERMVTKHLYPLLSFTCSVGPDIKCYIWSTGASGVGSCCEVIFSGGLGSSTEPR
ncbi:hypothetical protein G7Y89_g4197 [Cudoniella acicularis]|uniref:Tyrosine specific protein phosphatases domain-containing protein n=1 Tax=Cudoniella acicularis TaxID=354080 RepID=A0A8H4RQR8_9HELO|nr:hypothetical protein G7Y89_g4197 [Cudoniella acicularis]